MRKVAIWSVVVVVTLARGSGPAAGAADAPSLAVSPFDAKQAKLHQEAWSKHLGQPVELTNSIGMKLAFIPRGKFLMGSPDAIYPKPSSCETPQHWVFINPFYLGVYEVTQAQYQKVVGSNPSKFKGESLPVEFVDWNDAQAFCKRLSELPAERAAGRTYRLPNEPQ